MDGADMVIMLETFIVYHLFQNCQDIFVRKLKRHGNFPLGGKPRNFFAARVAG
jgi:hypothetical protein